jgi:hypothetical protein
MTKSPSAELELIETTDEEGNIHFFEKVEEVEVDGQRYALLIYQGTGDELEGEEAASDSEDAEDDEDGDEGYDEEIVVMKIGREDDAEVYEAIEDEAEFEKVIQYIESLTQDEDEEEAAAE